MVVTVEKETKVPVPKHNYTSVKPGAVSGNLRKLREEAKLGWAELARLSNIASTSIRRFEQEYEPPTNHPLLDQVQKALSKKLGRDVTEELHAGGYRAEFSPFEWARISQTWKPRQGAKGRSRSRIRNDAGFRIQNRKKSTSAEKVMTAPARVKSQAGASISHRVEAQKAGLKTMEAELKKLLANPRRLARTWAMTFNRHRMEGEEFILLPMDHFEKILAGYLQSLKVDPKVLIEKNFDELFS